MLVAAPVCSRGRSVRRLLISASAGELTGIAKLAYKRGEWDRSAELYDESLGLFRQLGFKATLAWSLNAKGDVERAR